VSRALVSLEPSSDNQKMAMDLSSIPNELRPLVEAKLLAP